MIISLLRWTIGLMALVGIWIGILAGVMYFGGPAPAALVILPAPGARIALPDGVAVIGVSAQTLTVIGGDDLAQRLYAAGAILVLPAGLQGCAGTGTATALL